VRIAFLAGVLGLLLAGCSSGGADDPGSAGRVYTDDTFGYSLRYPGDWHLDTSKDQWRVTIWETTVANFDAASGPSHEVKEREERGFLAIHLERDDRLEDFPPDGVALRIFHVEGGPGPDFGIGEADFPLSLGDFSTSEAVHGGTGFAAPPRPNEAPRPVEHYFGANGWAFWARAWIGPAASPQDRAGLERVVASIRFPPLRTGAIAAGERFDVLGHASEYPVRSAHRVRRGGNEYYLVHAPGGFYGLRGRCRPLRFDAAKFEFSCPSTGARWSRTGRPLASTASQSLGVLYAKMGQDGHILVARDVEVGMDPTFWRR
jgi:hypothetical protein